MTISEKAQLIENMNSVGKKLNKINKAFEKLVVNMLKVKDKKTKKYEWTYKEIAMISGSSVIRIYTIANKHKLKRRLYTPID